MQYIVPETKHLAQHIVLTSIFGPRLAKRLAKRVKDSLFFRQFSHKNVLIFRCFGSVMAAEKYARIWFIIMIYLQSAARHRYEWIQISQVDFHTDRT